MHCQAAQTWWNYLAWPRKCPGCGAYRGARVWVVELLFIAAGIWLWFNSPAGWTFWASMALLIYFGLVTVIDIEHRLILPRVSILADY